MVLPGFFFLTTRVIQLTFLIPIIGMLSYFVHGYVAANYLTPNFVLVLFIVSTLAGVWALATLLFYALAKHDGYLIFFIDIGIFAALIAGVYELRGIATENCSNFNTSSAIYVQLGTFAYSVGKSCNMLKACFALSIIEILLFFNSAFLGLWIHHHHKNDSDNKNSNNYRREEKRYSSRRSGRRSSSRSRSAPRAAPSDYYDDYDNRPRRGGGSTVGRSRSQQRAFV